MILARLFTPRGWQTEQLPGLDYLKAEIAWDTPGILASEGGIPLGSVLAGDGLWGDYDGSYSGVGVVAVPEMFTATVYVPIFADGDDPTDIDTWVGAYYVNHSVPDLPIGSKAIKHRAYWSAPVSSYSCVEFTADADLRVALALDDGTDPTLTQGQAFIGVPVMRGVYLREA